MEPIGSRALEVYYYIVNPNAGGGVIDSLQSRLKTELRKRHIDGQFTKTLGLGDATEMTAQAIAKGFKTIVAVGGDDTVSEVVKAVYENDKPGIAIGIIPIGHQNTLARALGIGHWKEACRRLASRRLREYSPMAAQDQIFIQSLTVSSSSPRQTGSSNPKARWLKRLSKNGRPSEFAYKLEIDDNYKIRGRAVWIKVTNQKLVDPTLTNQLVVQIDGGASSRILRRPKPSSARSQLLARTINLRCGQKVEVLIDGRELKLDSLQVGLTDRKLNLIA